MLTTNQRFNVDRAVESAVSSVYSNIAKARNSNSQPNGQEPGKRGPWKWVGWLIGFYVAVVVIKELMGSNSHGFGHQTSSDQIIHGSMAALAGALIGAFFSERFKPFRRLIFLLLVGLVCVVFLIAPEPIDLPVWFLGGAITAWMLLRVTAKRNYSSGGKGKKPGHYGTTEWATLEHLQEKRLLEEGGYLLGFYQQNGKRYPIYYRKDRHLLTVAPTRGGKGTTAIVPNLLLHKGSVLVIDPKGENARITAKQRKAMGQKIHVIDPFGITGMPSARFNPLDWLDENDPDVEENALMLADALILRSDGGGNSKFFEDSAVSILWGFILYVALDPRFKEVRNLGTVRDMMNLGNKRLFGMLNEMYEHPNRIVSSTAERALAMDEETRANVFSSLHAQTVFLESNRMRDSLSSSDFKFEDLKNELMTIYLVLPADRLKPYSRWMRLLIQQAITCNARNLGVKPPGGRPILFMLDELASLGKLTMIEEAYSLMAGFGLQLWGIIQDVSQLERIYGKGWETFISNSGAVSYYGSRDDKSASYFSKLCGVSTIEKVSFGQSISRAIGFSSSHSSSSSGSSSSSSRSDSTTTSHSVTADLIQRQLAFPDELMRMDEDQALLLVETYNPIDARKLAWFDNAELVKLGANIQDQPAPILPPQAYVEKPFVIPGTEGLSAKVDVATGKPVASANDNAEPQAKQAA